MGMCGSKSKDIYFVGIEALHESCRRPAQFEALATNTRPADLVVAQQFKDVLASIEAGDAKGLAHLLSDGGQLAKYKGPDGSTPLHAAARGEPECIALLLAAGAPVNSRNEAGLTPLMRAAEYGSAEAVSSLLGADADPTIEDKEGHAALWHAKAGGHEPIVAALGGSTTLAAREG